jgi:hypothetical protein
MVARRRVATDAEDPAASTQHLSMLDIPSLPPPHLPTPTMMRAHACVCLLVCLPARLPACRACHLVHVSANSPLPTDTPCSRRHTRVSHRSLRSLNLLPACHLVLSVCPLVRILVLRWTLSHRLGVSPIVTAPPAATA